MAPDFISFFKGLFHKHDWQLNHAHRYSVKRGDGSKEGEVTLIALECGKCGKEILIQADRAHGQHLN